MERLLAQIEDEKAEPTTTLIPTELVVRESTGPAR
jgi:DNA-binding LacI/PurR family transcriptional regulator